MGAMDQQHARLVELVVRYIDLVGREWPLVCVSRPDFTIDAAHNYGLGLIRMLAEYHVVTSRQDLVSVELAVKLEVARRAAAIAIHRQADANAQSTAGVRPSAGPKWRAGSRRLGKRTSRFLG